MPGDVVLLTGASGLLGTLLRRAPPSGCELVAVTHRHEVRDMSTVHADLRDADEVESAVRQARPSLVVHAAYAKDHASIVDATHNVARAAAEVGADILLVSTDAVFSGDGVPRGEDAIPDPIWAYGRWKAEAEHVVSTGAVASTIVRLPLIVSIEPDDHVVRRLRSAADRGGTTIWFGDEVRQPARGAELAAAIWRIVSLGPSRRTGVWHLPGPECLSRVEIARRVVTRLGLSGSSVRAESTPPDAQRPRRLLLRDDRARDAIGWSPTPVMI